MTFAGMDFSPEPPASDPHESVESVPPPASADADALVLAQANPNLPNSNNFLPAPRPQPPQPAASSYTPLPPAAGASSQQDHPAMSNSAIAATVTAITIAIIGVAFLINKVVTSRKRSTSSTSNPLPVNITQPPPKSGFFKFSPRKPAVKQDSESTIGDPSGNLLVHISKKASDPIPAGREPSWSLMDSVNRSLGRRERSGEYYKRLVDDPQEDFDGPNSQQHGHDHVTLFGNNITTSTGLKRRATGSARVDERDGRRFIDPTKNVINLLLNHIGDIYTLPLSPPIPGVRLGNGQGAFKISFPKQFASLNRKHQQQQEEFVNLEFTCVYPGNGRNKNAQEGFMTKLEVGDLVVVKRFLRDGWALGVNYGLDGKGEQMEEGLFPVFGVEEL
ncbi:hypothetical protein BDR26DRAFT_865674 [Obelidium mucronatum]|nr:hypothetical protein BDR26DRAFT_865674 [Obelidium mucronatum]